MEIILGLLIIAIGAFCQSSCYVPINRIKEWSWESYWIVQGVFAWLVFPFLGALLAVPDDNSLFEIYANNPADTLWTMFFGALWGVGGTDVWFVYALFRRSSWAVYRFGYLCRIGNDIDSGIYW